ncbi:MAG: hypothetical protein HUJ26_00095 [Planctomycetaceae bacterium]|nr:hypothetical protein [Planctomycetaceae bacterium]
MKIEILEEGGIKTEPYGHMQFGEVRVVADHHGKFYVGNGWASDLDEIVPTGDRGSLDHKDPETEFVEKVE